MLRSRSTSLILLAALLLSQTSFASSFQQQKARRRSALNVTDEWKPTSLPTDLGEHLFKQQSHPRRRLNPSKGSFTFLVLLVQFTDHQDRNLPSKEYFEELCNGSGPSDINPAGSIAEYFNKNSYGQFNVRCDVRDWALTDNTEDFYAAGSRGLVGTLQGQTFFKPVLDKIETQELRSDKFFFFNLDGVLDVPKDEVEDGDGFIELLVLHSGYASEAVETDCFGRGREDRIWSQGHKGADGGWKTSDSNFAVMGYTVASALDHLDDCQGGVGSKMGIQTHELFHTFGALDLYDPSILNIVGGVGAFDIMASPYGQGFDFAYPGLASPFTKIQAGWLEPIEITVDGVYEIAASITSDKVYILKENFPTGEYLLIENRQVGNWDKNLWGAGGLAIYHIDEDADKQNNAGFPGQLGWPQNGNHFQVAVVQADGHYDLEKAINDGDSGDFYVAGRSLSPGDGFTYPNTDSYQGGRLSRTGITITDISSSGPTMSFRVSGLSAVQNPAVSPVGSSAPTPNPAQIPPPTPTGTGAIAPSPAPTPAPSKDDASSATMHSFLVSLCAFLSVGAMLLIGV